VADPHALRKWRTGMRAGSGDGVDGFAVAEQQDRLAIDLDLAGCAVGDVGECGDVVSAVRH
jgi:hypothetical protein